MDVNELTKTLGLRDFAEVEFDSMKAAVAREETYGRTLAVANRRRSSGRTTRLMLEAFIEASYGNHVTFVVRTPSDRVRIDTIFRQWASKVYIPRLPLVVVADSTLSYAGGMGTQKFYDHYVTDPTT